MALCTIVFLIARRTLFARSIAATVRTLDESSVSASTTGVAGNLEGSKRKPLQQYASLHKVLNRIPPPPLIGLYFAASWCPASTTASDLMDKELSSFLLSPATEKRFDTSNDEASASDAQRELAIIYVSSDSSEEDMHEYLEEHNNSWWSIPYDASDRNDLKKHFLTCAKPEMEELHLNRKHEIPTLIILDGPSQELLTFEGVKDLEEHGGQEAVDHWKQLAKLSHALEAKFAYNTDDGDTPRW